MRSPWSASSLLPRWQRWFFGFYAVVLAWTPSNVLSSSVEASIPAPAEDADTVPAAASSTTSVLHRLRRQFLQVDSSPLVATTFLGTPHTTTQRSSSSVTHEQYRNIPTRKLTQDAVFADMEMLERLLGGSSLSMSL